MRRAIRAAIREHGQSAVEFALAAPFLLAFIFFIVDAGLLAYSYISVTNAVREGARCGAVGGTDAAVSARVVQASGGLVNTITVDTPSRGPNIGDSITITAHYTYHWLTPLNILPGLDLANFTFTKSATMRMETAPPYTKTTCT
jgi:Flp pilus assembly protein TadG